MCGVRTRRSRAAGVSVGVRTVGGMEITRHTCLWFDDADGVELLCGCGARAVAEIDPATGEAVLVVLADEPVRVLAAIA